MNDIDTIIEVLKAHRDGDQLQRKSDDGKWVDCNWSDSGLVSDLNEFKMRVKPEPMEIWVNVYENGVTAHTSKVRAHNSIPFGAETLLRTAKFREVLE